MATQSPFSWLEEFLQTNPLHKLEIPVWAVDELERRLLALMNHILIHEPQACTRLLSQRGKVIQVKWRERVVNLEVTAAGLLDRSARVTYANLIFHIKTDSPMQIIKSFFLGLNPDIHIEGDVELAGDVNWVIENIRWDIEDDISRIFGDELAYSITQVAKHVFKKLVEFKNSLAVLNSRAIREEKSKT